MPIPNAQIDASRRVFIACTLAGGVASTLPIAVAKAQRRRQPMEITLINIFAAPVTSPRASMSARMVDASSTTPRRVAALGTFEAIACEVSYVHHGE